MQQIITCGVFLEAICFEFYGKRENVGWYQSHCAPLCCVTVSYLVWCWVARHCYASTYKEKHHCASAIAATFSHSVFFCLPSTNSLHPIWARFSLVLLTSPETCKTAFISKEKKTGLACCLTQQLIWTEHISHTNTLLSTTREKWPFHLLSYCTRFKSLAKSWYEAQRYGVERSAHVNVIMTFFSVKKKPSLVKCHLSVPKSFKIVASSSLSCTFNPDKLPPQYTNTLNSNLKSVRPRVSR